MDCAGRGLDTQHAEAVLRVMKETRSTRPVKTSVELAVDLRAIPPITKIRILRRYSDRWEVHSSLVPV
jgi:hypothetical protein